MRINDITTLVTKNTTLNILSNLGININPNRNFALRDDDKNPSASIYIKNGKVRIHDFGIGFDGDLIDVLVEFFNLSYSEAKDLIASYLGIDNKKIDLNTLKKEFKPIARELFSYRQIKEIWNKYTPLAALSEDKAKEVINKLIPVEYYLTAKEDDKKAFYKVVRYDPKQDEPVVATFTPVGNILTIRHRRYKVGDNIIKWKSLKNTQANKYTQIRIKNPHDPVFIIEGTHDYTTALLLGINFIALPSKNYKTFKAEELSLLKDRYDFVILPDLDFENEEDEKYKKFKKELLNSLDSLIPQLQPYTKRIIAIWNLKKRFSYFKGIENIKDLSDLCTVSDLYDSAYLKVFHLLASFIEKDISDFQATLNLIEGGKQ